MSAIVLLCWALLSLSTGLLAPPIAEITEEVQVGLGLDMSRGERTR